MSPSPQPEAWPDLPYAAWKETCATLHLWTQIVGKVRLARTPWLNHSWHVPLYVTARRLTTSPIPDGQRSFEIAFDLIEHVLDGLGGTAGLAALSNGQPDAHREGINGRKGESGVRRCRWRGTSRTSGSRWGTRPRCRT